jgi:phenylacetate-CoA ligase
LPGFVFPTIPDHYAGIVWHIISQLRRFERFTPQQAARQQAAQLTSLLRHAFRQSPFWRERLTEAGWTPEDLADHSLLRSLPPLSRADLQTRFGDMRARLDPGYGPITTVQTSGSTGNAVRVEKCRAQSFLYDALTMRDHFWHRRDLSKKLSVIRGKVKTGPRPNWGHPVSRLVKSGPASALNAESLSLEGQLDWLVAEKPTYLLLSGMRLDAIAQFALERAVRIENLQQITSYATAVSPEIRALAREAFGVEIKDLYSTEEVGYIACQCPEHDVYHVQSEAVIAEIVDENGAPARVGEPGRVLVTVLHSFAMPLIRYDIGDMAVAGEPCACGRTLPVITRILGRQETMLTLPDGRRILAGIRARDFMDIAPVRDYRVVMYADDVVDVFVTAQDSLQDSIRENIARMVQTRLCYPFPTRVKQVKEIDWGKSWKREPFVRVKRASG